MMDIAQLLVTVPAITATVQWAKNVFKMSGRWSQLAAVIVGMIFTLAAAAVTYHGGLDVHGVLRSLCEGFLYGLAAAGFYDVAHGNLRGVAYADESSTSSTSDTTILNGTADSELASSSVVASSGVARRGRHAL